ncbi:Thiosulfate sulfurtransferase PspE [Thalassocella blandensis]|nr:Thiosulfate sulfurtransferase PspE [Thalassocella blandensis]
MDFLTFLSEEWILVSILIVLAGAYFYMESLKGGKSLGIHEVTRLVNSDSAILLDVRESKDYKNGHIVDAINIPFDKLSERSNELDKHKSKTIIVIDKMGQHSGTSGKILLDKGFTVNRLQGGMSEWTNQNLPVVKG